jgi:hypothetical protein
MPNWCENDLTVKGDKRTLGIPNWLTSLAPDSSLNSRDVTKLFKLSYAQIMRRVEAGRFPKPDREMTRGNNRLPCKQWRASTIIDFLKGILNVQ